MKNTIITLILFTLLISCKQNKESEIIKIATLKGPSSMGMIKMIDSLDQISEKNIEISIYNEPILVRKLMLEEEVDMAVIPTTMAAILYNKKVDYKLCAIPVWGTLYLFGNDTTIKTWEDLKGKKINVMAKGMTPDVLFKYLLIENNIDPNKDVKLDYSFPTHIDLANAVAAGQANLGVISEPLVSLVMHKNKSVFPIFDLNTEWKKVTNNTPIAQTALVVHSEFLNNNPDQVEKILNDYKQSSEWVNQHHKEAAKLIVHHGIIPNIDVAISSIPRSNLRFTKSNTVKKDIYSYFQIFFNLDPKIIGGQIPDSSFLNLD